MGGAVLSPLLANAVATSTSHALQGAGSGVDTAVEPCRSSTAPLSRLDIATWKPRPRPASGHLSIVAVRSEADAAAAAAAAAASEAAAHLRRRARPSSSRPRGVTTPHDVKQADASRGRLNRITVPPSSPPSTADLRRRHAARRVVDGLRRSAGGGVAAAGGLSRDPCLLGPSRQGAAAAVVTKALAEYEATLCGGDAAYGASVLRGALNTLLAGVFVGWGAADAACIDAASRCGGPWLAAFFSRKEQWRGRAAAAAGAAAAAPAGGSSPHLSPSAHGDGGGAARGDGFSDAFHRYVKGRERVSVSTAFVRGACFRVWRAGAVRMRQLRRRVVARVADTRQAAELRVVLQAWRRTARAQRLQSVHDREDHLLDSISKRAEAQAALVSEVVRLRAAADGLAEAGRGQQAALAAYAGNPGIVDLRRPLSDGCDDVIKHGVVEFRHFTHDEQAALCAAAAPAAAAATAERLATSSCLVCYPFAATSERLRAPVARLPYKASEHYYVPIGIRGLSAAEEDSFGRAGTGYVNRREFVLTWANTRVAEAFPLAPGEDPGAGGGGVRLKSYTLGGFEPGYADCRALLNLVNVVAPQAIVGSCSVAETHRASVAARRERVAVVLAQMGLYGRQDVLRTLESPELFCEEWYNLLLCQLFTYDSLRARLRADEDPGAVGAAAGLGGGASGVPRRASSFCGGAPIDWGAAVAVSGGGGDDTSPVSPAPAAEWNRKKESSLRSLSATALGMVPRAASLRRLSSVSAGGGGAPKQQAPSEAGVLVTAASPRNEQHDRRSPSSTSVQHLRLAGEGGSNGGGGSGGGGRAGVGYHRGIGFRVLPSTCTASCGAQCDLLVPPPPPPPPSGPPSAASGSEPPTPHVTSPQAKQRLQR